MADWLGAPHQGRKLLEPINVVIVDSFALSAGAAVARLHEATLALADNFGVTEVVAIEPAAIKVGSFVGIAAVPAVDATLSALEVLVFPEAARGSGEGHYPWDLQPGSMMTNATVADVAAAPQGRQLRLRYKDGEKTVTVPAYIYLASQKWVLGDRDVNAGRPSPDRSIASRSRRTTSSLVSGSRSTRAPYFRTSTSLAMSPVAWHTSKASSVHCHKARSSRNWRRARTMAARLRNTWRTSGLTTRSA